MSSSTLEDFWQWTKFFYRERLEVPLCQELNSRGLLDLGLSAGVNRLFDRIDKLRASELRNLLRQELHMDHASVATIIDRAELRELAKRVVVAEALQECRQVLFRVSVVIPLTLILLLVLVLVFSKQYKSLKPYLRAVLVFFINEDRFWQKVKLARKCAKRLLFLALIAVCVSLVLDILIVWINISIGLSWILPYHSQWRQFLFFGLSLPVNAGMLSSMMTARRNSPVTDDFESQRGWQGWSFNIGTTLTLVACRWLGQQLDDFAAGRLLRHRSAVHMKDRVE